MLLFTLHEKGGFVLVQSLLQKLWKWRLCTGMTVCGGALSLWECSQGEPMQDSVLLDCAEKRDCSCLCIWLSQSVLDLCKFLTGQCILLSFIDNYVWGLRTGLLNRVSTIKTFMQVLYINPAFGSQAQSV